jgi:FeS assembly SUF system regulator
MVLFAQKVDRFGPDPGLKMIRITKQTDYGVVLLTHLAQEPNRLSTTQELADETQLPLPMASKILKMLAREGVLESHRGAKGGYALARPAQAITVTEIISALEGPIAVTECIDGSPGDCDYTAFCPVRSNWHQINLAIRQALDGITLADMTIPLAEGNKLVTLGSRPAEMR